MFGLDLGLDDILVGTAGLVGTALFPPLGGVIASGVVGMGASIWEQATEGDGFGWDDLGTIALDTGLSALGGGGALTAPLKIGGKALFKDAVGRAAVKDQGKGLFKPSTWGDSFKNRKDVFKSPWGAGFRSGVGSVIGYNITDLFGNTGIGGRPNLVPIRPAGMEYRKAVPTIPPNDQ
ncbi:hypothetical protein B0T36_03060 [Nocardia donostiensis]|uniref:hypothetical protein n=1 Tax=Nocardia donostiensis TaxID=1538463 RepID=UPI0009D99BCE|nr:hypothetical protein [Nocardia donostiensis]OQS16666.1 hypothetical protein B0T36_03060 [Nocardia donostiensis]